MNRSQNTYQLFKLRKCTNLRKQLSNFEFDGSNMFQKSWDGGIKRVEK